MSAEHKYSGWRRRRRWLAFAFVAFALAGFMVFRSVSSARGKNMVQSVQQRGLPTNPVELEAWYRRVPAGQNAALLYLEAAAEHLMPPARMDPDQSKEKTEPGEPLPPKLAAAVADYVSKNALCLEKLESAAKLSASRYPVDLSSGFAALLPHLAQVKEMAQLLKWAAIHESAGGQPDQAVKRLLHGFALAASLEEEPILISQLVRIACVAILLSAAERVVSEHQLSESQLLALQTAVRKAEENGRRGMLRAIAGERANAIPVFRFGYREFAGLASVAPTGHEFGDALKITAYGLRGALGLREADLRFYIKNMEALERAMELDFPQMLRSTDQIVGAMEQELSEHPWKYMISRLLMPSLGNSAQKEASLVARLRCARMALAIERFRGKSGGMLPRLDQLVPAFLDVLPTDPADGNALEYRLNPSNAYSVVASASTGISNKGRKPVNFKDVAFTVVR